MAETRARHMRDAIGDVLVELGERDERVVVVDGDLAHSTRAHRFAERFPARFFELGIQEQNIAGVAAGLAAAGAVPFVSTFAIFAAGRAWEQVRLSIGYGRWNVKILATHAGLSVGADGASHQMTEDFALMGVVPGMVVLSPSDYPSAVAAIRAAYEHDGPAYVRFARPATPKIHAEPSDARIPLAVRLVEGRRASVIATGLMTHEALAAAREVGDTAVYDAVSVKPLDDECLRDAARSGRVLVCEDHQRWGGLGSAVATRMAELSLAPSLAFVNVGDRFGRSGSIPELYEAYGLNAKAVADALRRLTNER